MLTFQPVVLRISCISFLVNGRIPISNGIRRHGFFHDSVCPNEAVVANGNVSDNFRPDPDQDVITDLGGISISASVANGNFMVYGTILSDFSRRMKDNSAEVMDSKAFSDFATGRDGDPCCYFYYAFNHVSEWLRRYTPKVAPAKKSINNNGLKARRQNTGKKIPPGELFPWSSKAFTVFPDK